MRVGASSSSVGLALGLALLAMGTAQAGPGLVLTIELDKRSFVLYESVTVQCRLANPAPKAIETLLLFGRDPEDIRFSITQPDGTTREHRHLGIDDRVRIVIRQEPGSVQAVEANLYWNAATDDWAFPTPGTYRIAATAWTGIGQEATKVESNTIEITVKKPKAIDARAIGFFSTGDEFLRLLRHGTYEYCRGKTDHECLIEIGEFLRRFHASAYSPDLVWDLWSRRAPGLTGFDPSEYALFWDFERFLKEWPRDPSAPRVMYRLAMILAGGQRLGEAREVLARFEQTFPKQELLARHLRENLEWCAAASKAPSAVELPSAETHLNVCDQNGDGVCDAVDISIFVSAIGASAGDAGYSFALDLDDDGWVLDDDMSALFPGLNFDGDSICNDTDNCLTVSNPAQVDADGDGHGDLCDCAASNPALFAPPLEITGLILPADGSFSWESDAAHSGSSTEYDVLAGALAELPVGGGASEWCVSAASPITIETDTLDPPPGSGFYYLIRGRNACGAGTYGKASNATPRASSTCPGN